nr:nucleoside-diphosphate sugar epimerase [Variovorax boronicumulans]
MKVLLAGATGLVGREILALLLADRRVAAVHTLGRRAPPTPHAKLHHHPSDLRSIPALPPLDSAFIALGTTIKVAGSQQAFRAVDHDAVLAVARATRAAGARRLGLVSAMGADAGSRVFYNRVKGEVEQAVAQIGFESLVVARPSLLVGDRGPLGQPARRGEVVGEAISRWLRPLIPANYRPIRAADVARALVDALAQGQAGRRVLLSGAMQRG